VKKTTIALILISVVCVSLMIRVQFAKSSPKTIFVPDDYRTIHEAIGNATAGDTVFVKKGTYQEQTLEINKPLTLLGEDVNETTINFNPPLVNVTFPNQTIMVHSTAISIRASTVRLSSFTINLPDDNYACIDGLSAIGDRIDIIGNILGRGCNLNLNGTLLSVAENSMRSGLQVYGYNQTIARNLIHGLISQGTCNRIVENIVNGSFSLRGYFNLVVGNSFSTMYLEDSDSNFISNNTFRCLWIGINRLGCSYNTICKNRVTGPDNWGILMGTGSYNIFHDNLISNYTGGYGIAVGGNNLVAEHNVFYRNILMNNGWHVSANWEILGPGNYWDNGKEGNYWDDYTGIDSNNDGMGDAPYVVEGCKWDDAAGGIVGFVFGHDDYPLMSPFDIDSVSIELPEWASALLNLSIEPQAPEPFPITRVVAIPASVVALSVGLIVYFKKRKR